MLHSVQPQALAVRLPFGDGLRSGVLSLLGSLSGAPGKWMVVVFAAGSSPVGVQMLQVAVNLAMVAAGILLFAATYADFPPSSLVRWISPSPVRISGLICAVYGARAELRLPWGSGSGGEMALSMVATKLLGLNSRLYLAALPYGELLSLAINVLLIALAVVTGTAAILLVLHMATLRSVLSVLRLRAMASRAELVRAVLPIGVGSVLLLAPMEQAVMFATPKQPVEINGLSEARPDSGPAAEASGDHMGFASGEVADGLPADTQSPSTITISSQASTFEYRVNGRREFIRGIGYNAVTVGETPAERAATYDRDFSAISAAAANTIVGWSEREFDELLMQKAAEYGLGVILPFELLPAWAYDDPSVRQQLFARITDRVEQYKNDPALRIWGLGNEVLHDMTSSRSRHAQAFADFLVQAADLVHALDPNHPVVYRDAEDVYLAPVERALRASGEVRPWFIYGMNFFTERLAEALTKGPARRLHQPIMISEFAPVGLRAADRPAGYGKLWSIVTNHRDVVLGGCAYAWSTAGPEPLDRGFGLTNERGEPVDGSLSTLASLFATDRAQASRY